MNVVDVSVCVVYVVYVSVYVVCVCSCTWRLMEDTGSLSPTLSLICNSQALSLNTLLAIYLNRLAASKPC